MTTPAIQSHLGPSPDQVLLRDGFRLISTRRIALPVWRVTLACRLLTRRPVPAIEEFVLRAIGLGVASSEEIRALLNLPVEVCDGVVRSLIADRHVILNPGEDGVVGMRLSPTGSRLVETLIDEKPVEKPVTFSVDGITAQPTSSARSALLSAKDLDDSAHLVVELEDDVDLDFGPADTARFSGSLPSARDGKDSLLSILGSESSIKMYRPAVGLLFESTSDSEDLYLRVCIDGRSQEQLEEALRETGALRSMRLEARINEDRVRIERALGERLQGARIPDAELERLRADAGRLGPTPVTLSASAESSPNTSSRASQARDRLADVSVGRLDCVSTQESLRFAMSTAQADILISSSRFWPAEAADEYATFIRQLLDAGVSVSIEVPADDRQIARADAGLLKDLLKASEGTSLAVWNTKAPHEANFVAIDGATAYLFASSPFYEVGRASERFGDDRPTVVLGFDNVQEVLQTVHSRSNISTQPKTTTRRFDTSRRQR
jgi:hypothetical protein